MKKLASKRGFTLTEMLIAVLLLGFVSIMAAVMTSAVLNNTVIVKEVAQAEILGSEALDNIQSELRFALNVQVQLHEGEEKATELHFGHNEANPDCFMTLNDGKIILKIKQPPKAGSSSDWSEDVLFDGVSYGNNLKIYSLTFEADKDNNDNYIGSVKATVSVSYGDDKVLWQGSVSIRPINGAVKVTNKTE